MTATEMIEKIQGKLGDDVNISQSTEEILVKVEDVAPLIAGISLIGRDSPAVQSRFGVAIKFKIVDRKDPKETKTFVLLGDDAERLAIALIASLSEAKFQHAKVFAT